MNPRTTLLLTALLGLLALAWVLVDDPLGAPSTDLSRTLLGLDDPTEVSALTLRDGSGKLLWRLERDDADWRVAAEDPSGRSVFRARRESVQDLLGFLLEVRPLAVHDETPGEDALRRYGLRGDDVLILGLEGPSSQRRLSLGAEMAPGAVLVRVDDRGAVLRADRLLLDEIPPSAAALRDRRIFDLPALEVDRISVGRPDPLGASSRRFALERAFGEWLLRGAVEGPGDRIRVEAFRGELLRLRDGEPLPAGISPDFEAALIVEMAAGDDRQRLEVGAPDREGVPVRLRDGTPRLLPLGTWAILDREPLEFRERRLLPARPGVPLELDFGAAGRAPRLAFRRGRARLRIEPPEGGERRLVRELEQRELRTRLEALSVIRWDEGLGSLEDDATEVLRVRFEGRAQEDVLLFGPAERGERPVEIRASGLRGWVGARELAFLDRPWWEFLELDAGGYAAWWRLAELSVQDGDGAIRLLPKLVGEQPRLELVLDGGERRRELPEELSRRAYEVLGVIRPERFLGPVPPEECGLESPALRVGWRLNPASTAQRLLPPTEDGLRGVLEIGAPLGERSHHARSSADPDLVFEIARPQFAVFERILEWARR